MHYRAKEFPLSGHVADSDAVMRELNRAMSAVDGEVDQNNIKDESIKYSLVRDSFGEASIRSTSLVGTNVETTPATGKLYAQVQGGGATDEISLSPACNAYNGKEDEADRNVSWEWIKNTTTQALMIEVDLRELTRAYIVVNGQAEVPNQGTLGDGLKYVSEFDVRLLVNNRPLDEYGTFSCICNGGYVPFHLSTFSVLRPGVNQIKAQIRDRTPRADSAHEPQLKYFNTYMFTFGHTK